MDIGFDVDDHGVIDFTEQSGARRVWLLGASNSCPPARAGLSAPRLSNPAGLFCGATGLTLSAQLLAPLRSASPVPRVYVGRVRRSCSSAPDRRVWALGPLCAFDRRGFRRGPILFDHKLDKWRAISPSRGPGRCCICLSPHYQRFSPGTAGLGSRAGLTDTGLTSASWLGSEIWSANRGDRGYSVWGC